LYLPRAAAYASLPAKLVGGVFANGIVVGGKEID
jgi:hypothetical protein